jgi:hypothetical protein
MIKRANKSAITMILASYEGNAIRKKGVKISELVNVHIKGIALSLKGGSEYNVPIIVEAKINKILSKNSVRHKAIEIIPGEKIYRKGFFGFFEKGFFFLSVVLS